jgi:hypothetical protein
MSLSIAMESRYTTKHRKSIMVKVEEVLWAWHARVEGFSGWM